MLHDYTKNLVSCLLHKDPVKRAKSNGLLFYEKTWFYFTFLKYLNLNCLMIDKV